MVAGGCREQDAERKVQGARCRAQGARCRMDLVGATLSLEVVVVVLVELLVEEGGDSGRHRVSENFDRLFELLFADST